MRQNSDDLWKAVDMTDVDEFKSFHLIIKTRINQQQNLTKTEINSLRKYRNLRQDWTKKH